MMTNGLILSPLTDRDFERLLIVLLAVTLVSTAGWVISLCLRRHAALRHLILFCSMNVCLACPLLVCGLAATDVKLFSVPLLKGDSPQQVTFENPVSALPTPVALESINKAVCVTTPASTDLVDTSISLQCPVVASAEEATEVFARAEILPIKADPDQPARTVASFRDLLNIVVRVWLVGVLFLLGRLACHACRVISLRRSAARLDAGAEYTLLQEVATELRLRRIPQLCLSPRAIVPIAVGFGRPAIIIGGRLLERLNTEQLRDVLLHEAAHLARGDHWKLLLQEVARAIYWPVLTFHGLHRELQRAREELCDNCVLAYRNALQYGETLLHVAQVLIGARSMSAAVGFLGTTGELERRIRGLIDPHRDTKTSVGRRMTVTVMTLFLIGGMTASATRFAVAVHAAGEAEEKVDSAAATATGDRSEHRNPSRFPLVQHLPQISESSIAAPKIDLERMIELKGSVQDAERRPVAGAALHLSSDTWTDPVTLGVTDANGAYRFIVSEKSFRMYMDGTPRPEIHATLIVTAAGFGAEWMTLQVAEQDGTAVLRSQYRTDFALNADVPVSGRIVSADGKPVAGADVSIASLEPLAEQQWQTMTESFKKAGKNSDRREFDPRLWKNSLNRTAWRMVPAAVSDAQGRFVVTGLGRNRVATLNVSGPGIRSTSVSVLTRDNVEDTLKELRAKFPRTPQPTGYYYPPRKELPPEDFGVPVFGTSVTIETDPARTISGVIRDANSGAPIPMIRVVSGYMSEYSDRHGRFRIVRSDDEPTVVLFVQPYNDDRYLGVIRQYDNGRELGDISADIKLAPGISVNGRVVESGTDRPIVSGPRYTCHAPWPGVVWAGVAYYYPLTTNEAIRGTPTGVFFQGGPARATNYSVSARIDEAGRFRLAVPPGPGVILITAAPGAPMFYEFGSFTQSQGLHRLFPYKTLTVRDQNDGAPLSDPQAFDGMSAPIPLTNHHAYRVINPSADATELGMKFEIPRAPSRTVKFTDPNGKPLPGVLVRGILPPLASMSILLDDPEVELLNLSPEEPREVVAVSHDGKFAARADVGIDDRQPHTIRLEPAGTLRGRLVDSETGQALGGYTVAVTGSALAFHGPEIKTDREGRFAIASLIPHHHGKLVFTGPRDDAKGFGYQPPVYEPESVRDIVLDSGETRDLGDITIKVVVEAKP